jgi:hypothetical protein
LDILSVRGQHYQPQKELRFRPLPKMALYERGLQLAFNAFAAVTQTRLRSYYQ